MSEKGLDVDFSEIFMGSSTFLDRYNIPNNTARKSPVLNLNDGTNLDVAENNSPNGKGNSKTVTIDQC